MSDQLLIQPLRFTMFYHSVLSDWNNGNAHFVRGVVRNLIRRGHIVTVYEPRNAWSVENLERETGDGAEANFRAVFPEITYVRYEPETIQLDEVVDEADVVIVHEWSDHDLVAALGRCRLASGDFVLLFHDTHHRMVTAPDTMAAYDLSGYDGVLAFGNVIRDLYLSRGLAQQAWTWHEAADVSLFKPPDEPVEKHGDVLWIGNWGDGERTEELKEYLFDPACDLKLKCCAYGVRYPEEGLATLHAAGITYCGWLPNHAVPSVAAKYRAMVHVPRRPYVQSLPGIPTIRPFEAMACGIPLVSSYWNDAEELFVAGRDYVMARNGDEMRRQLRDVLNDDGMAQELAANGLRTIRERHTCAHRVNELLQICEELKRNLARRIAEICPTNG